MTGRKHVPVIPGYQDVFCQICGFGPRAVLSKHVVNAHDGIAAYRKQFGYDSLTSEDFRFNMKSLWKDHAEDGIAAAPYRKQKTCKHGHRWTAKNTMWVRVKYRGKWKMARHCRECDRTRNRERWRRLHPHEPRPCENPECGKVYPPVRTDQKYCSKQCAWKMSHSRRPTTTAGREAKVRARRIREE